MQKIRFCVLIPFIVFLTIPLAAQPVSHTLQQGETLYSLSRKYGVSVSEIMNANSITSPETLSVGSRLVIPGTNSGDNRDNSPSSRYIVQKGDTFYRIARNHNLTVKELMQLNDFSGNRILRPGESLIVSGASAAETVAVASTREERPAPADVNAGPLNTSASNQVIWPVDGSKQTLTGKLRGIKIEAPEASLVRSVASGTVVWSGPYRGFGQVILIDVKGYIYLYGGNEDVFVNVGEYVSAGSRIGRLGNSGLASRTVDMYFSVFKEGVPVSVVSAPRG